MAADATLAGVALALAVAAAIRSAWSP